MSSHCFDCVLLQRPGSIIADYEIKTTTDSPNNPEFVEANNKVANTLTSMGFPVAENAFAESGKGLHLILNLNLIILNSIIFISIIIACKNVNKNEKVKKKIYGFYFQKT